jgi:hypothetical protein
VFAPPPPVAAPRPAVPGFTAPPPASPVFTQPPAAPVFAPPPAAAPKVIAPPPVASFVPPVPHGNAPSPSPPPPSPAKRTEATIDEVPSPARPLADQIVDLLRSLGNREDLAPPAKKALQDANTKLPFVFAAFRDGTADAELIQSLTVFIQKLLGSDAAAANAIKRQLVPTHTTKCRDVIVWMGYILNAMK